jgi:hypothetical protein
VEPWGSRSGQHETAGTWKARTSGIIAIPGTVSIEPDQITAIEARLPGGTTLVTTLRRPNRKPAGAARVASTR